MYNLVLQSISSSLQKLSFRKQRSTEPIITNWTTKCNDAKLSFATFQVKSSSFTTFLFYRHCVSTKLIWYARNCLRCSTILIFSLTFLIAWFLSFFLIHQSLLRMLKAGLRPSNDRAWQIKWNRPLDMMCIGTNSSHCKILLLLHNTTVFD